jgi:hypothetical protein
MVWARVQERERDIKNRLSAICEREAAAEAREHRAAAHATTADGRVADALERCKNAHTEARSRAEAAVAADRAALAAQRSALEEERARALDAREAATRVLSGAAERDARIEELHRRNGEAEAVAAAAAARADLMHAQSARLLREMDALRLGLGRRAATDAATAGAAVSSAAASLQALEHEAGWLAGLRGEVEVAIKGRANAAEEASSLQGQLRHAQQKEHAAATAAAAAQQQLHGLSCALRNTQALLADADRGRERALSQAEDCRLALRHANAELRAAEAAVASRVAPVPARGRTASPRGYGPATVSTSGSRRGNSAPRPSWADVHVLPPSSETLRLPASTTSASSATMITQRLEQLELEEAELQEEFRLYRERLLAQQVHMRADVGRVFANTAALSTYANSTADIPGSPSSSGGSPLHKSGSQGVHPERFETCSQHLADAIVTGMDHSHPDPPTSCGALCAGHCAPATELTMSIAAFACSAEATHPAALAGRQPSHVGAKIAGELSLEQFAGPLLFSGALDSIAVSSHRPASVAACLPSLDTAAAPNPTVFMDPLSNHYPSLQSDVPDISGNVTVLVASPAGTEADAGTSIPAAEGAQRDMKALATHNRVYGLEPAAVSESHAAGAVVGITAVLPAQAPGAADNDADGHGEGGSVVAEGTEVPESLSPAAQAWGDELKADAARSSPSTMESCLEQAAAVAAAPAALFEHSHPNETHATAPSSNACLAPASPAQGCSPSEELLHPQMLLVHNSTEENFDAGATLAPQPLRQAREDCPVAAQAQVESVAKGAHEREAPLSCKLVTDAVHDSCAQLQLALEPSLGASEAWAVHGAVSELAWGTGDSEQHKGEEEESQEQWPCTEDVQIAPSLDREARSLRLSSAVGLVPACAAVIIMFYYGLKVGRICPLWASSSELKWESLAMVNMSYFFCFIPYFEPAVIRPFTRLQSYRGHSSFGPLALGTGDAIVLPPRPAFQSFGFQKGRVVCLPLPP